jgi:hypothetical protein
MKRRSASTLVLTLSLLGTLLVGRGLAGKTSHMVTITGGPSGTVASVDADFEFASTESATFTCSRDGAAATSCGSGRQGSAQYRGLAPGPHRFSVIATVVRPPHTARADRSWTIAPPPPPADTTPPETTIGSAVAGPVLADGATLPLDLGTVPLNIATFTFSANESATFTCKLDGRAFPCTSPLRNPHLATGAHRFEVQARDLAGNVDATPAATGWRIGPVVGEVVAQATPLRIPRRAKLVRAADLLARNAHPLPPPLPLEREEIDEFREPPIRDEPGDDDCRIVACGARGPGSASRPRVPKGAQATPTPPLSRGPYIAGTGGNDPNIAASSTHLVVTNNGAIRFYTKSGKLVKQDKNGNAITNPLAAWQFFWPAWFNPANPPTINQGLGLPAGLKCDPTIDVFGPSAQTNAVANCMDEVYDTRVIFDRFRKRFWLVSSVRNDSITNFWKLPSAQRAGRRDRLLVAVSSSEDPTDFWYVYGFSGGVDQGACNNLGSSPGPPPVCPGTKYRPLHATDYPAIGISQDYFVVAITVPHFNPWAALDDAHTGSSYTSISVFDANLLATGGCPQDCSWQYGPFKAGIVTSSGTVVLSAYPFAELVQPAVQHDSTPAGSTVLASVIASHDLVAVLTFSKKEKYIAPPLHIHFVPIAPAATGIQDMPQRPAAPVTNPLRVKLSNMGSSALKAATRDDKLYLTWMDCKVFDPTVETECSSAIRFLSLSLDSLEVSREETLGLPYPSYGNSAVEVNKLGDAVVVYNRSGTGTFLQARYTAFYHGESGFPDGATLKAGTFPYGANAVAGGPTSAGNLDTGGIAVDPFDDTGIWIAHAFSKSQTRASGGFDTAVGKVFGTLYADLSLSTLGGVGVKPKHLIRGRQFAITGDVSNGGDGRSRAVRGRAFLLGGRARVPLGTFAVQPLAAGATARFRLSGRLPETVRPGRYELEVRVGTSGKEYSTSNNVGRRDVVVASSRAEP